MTVKTITKGITFEQAMKLFTKFVARKETRPVLKLVYFNGTHLVGTDSHQLLRINKDYITDFPHDKESFFYDPRKMEYVDFTGNYPDTSRIIPDSLYSNSTVDINKNLKDLFNTVKEAKKHVKKEVNNVIKLEFTHNDLTISGKRTEEKEDASGIPVETIETYTNTLENVLVTGESITLHLSAVYFLNALEVTKKLSKLTEQTTINMTGHLRPVHITNEAFDALVLPVRTVH